MNALAVTIVALTALMFEGLAAPSFGFYLIPALIVLFVYFSLPIVVRSVNTSIAGIAGFLALVVWQTSFVFFTVPYFVLISLTLYGISKK